MNQPTISPSDEFVRNVMSSLPQRESLLQRFGRLLLAFVLSPLWMWSCLVLVVALFHKPLFVLLWTMTDSATTNILIVAASILATIAIASRQMINDLSLNAQ